MFSGRTTKTSKTGFAIAAGAVVACCAAAFGAGAADPQPFHTTQSGLKYRVLRKSDAAKPTAADTVTVHYKGWLDDGTVFDSSYDRKKPTTFPLGNVIPGWTEGLQLIGKGGKIELLIPSQLGYGARGAGNLIPPNSTLHFEVELIDIQ